MSPRVLDSHVRKAPFCHIFSHLCYGLMPVVPEWLPSRCMEAALFYRGPRVWLKVPIHSDTQYFITLVFPDSRKSQPSFSPIFHGCSPRHIRRGLTCWEVPWECALCFPELALNVLTAFALPSAVLTQLCSALVLPDIYSVKTHANSSVLTGSHSSALHLSGAISLSMDCWLHLLALWCDLLFTASLPQTGQWIPLKGIP